MWKILYNDECLWKKEIFPILKETTSKCNGSFIEEKRFSYAWHYRKAEEESGYNNSRVLINNLQKIIHSNNLKILDSHKVIMASVQS